jgi:hypothetical protein
VKFRVCGCILTLKKGEVQKLFTSKKFRIHLGTFSSFQIQDTANACREKKMRNNQKSKAWLHFQSFSHAIISKNVFSENPASPKIFLVFFMASLCRWLQNETIKFSNFEYFFFMQPYLKEKVKM